MNVIRQVGTLREAGRLLNVLSVPRCRTLRDRGVSDQFDEVSSPVEG